MIQMKEVDAQINDAYSPPAPELSPPDHEKLFSCPLSSLLQESLQFKRN